MSRCFVPDLPTAVPDVPKTVPDIPTKGAASVTLA
jgi:hypothetical protein